MIVEVKVYNNLTRMKETFKPLNPGEVKFYSCGPTTYDFVHVGNARAFVIGDLIYRTFLALGYKVTFVRNFTDVDDKIIKRAQENGVDPLEHSAKFVEESKQDMDSLGMLPPTYTPKVSETIDAIIEMVQELVDKGFAYEVDGEVLYHVPKFKGYGKLSKKDLDSLQHGIRIEVEDHKKHPSDFVLWKPSKEGEPAWDSPWGKGRPGWHIECSAMAKKYLGDTIDMHHGGVDLIFPHHENEIAQSEASSGTNFCNYWCHNEFLNFGKEKMSKSLGNVITIRNFVETYGGEILRQLLVSVHYRSVLIWTEEVVERAINDSERIHKFLKSYQDAKKLNCDEKSEGTEKEVESVVEKMKKELANDFNTPGALSHFFSMIRLLNREYLDENKNYKKKKKLSSKIVKATDEAIEFTKLATGLVYDDYDKILNTLNNAKKNLKGSDSLDEAKIEQLVQERIQARKDKNWARADEIRDELGQAGVVIKDNPDGTVSWSYK